MDKVETRNFIGYLMLNWKTKQMRVLKKQKTIKYNPYEIPIKINIKINVPVGNPEIEAKGEFNLSSAKVTEMFLHEV